jgi:peptidyl-prolyl cis-trans isomerase C
MLSVSRETLNRLLREPLVHFLVAGALVFAFNALRGEAVDVGSRRITLNQDQVERLAAFWVQTWRRPPTEAELDGMIRDYIKEEIYYREALRLGLDRDDAVIRRRLRGKMEFLITAETENATPTEAELQAWLDAHPERYGADPLFSFDQVYVAAPSGPDAATRRAREILARLDNGGDASSLGDPILLPHAMTAAPKAEIASQFGDGFANALAQAPRGAWSGPIASEYGMHLVRLRAVAAEAAPVLAEVRQAVENDWRAETRARREAEAYQALLDGYDVTIERPQ